MYLYKNSPTISKECLETPVFCLTRLIESVELETSLNIQVWVVILASQRLRSAISFYDSDEANGSKRSDPSALLPLLGKGSQLGSDSCGWDRDKITALKIHTHLLWESVKKVKELVHKAAALSLSDAIFLLSGWSEGKHTRAAQKKTQASGTGQIQSASHSPYLRPPAIVSVQRRGNSPLRRYCSWGDP